MRAGRGSWPAASWNRRPNAGSDWLRSGVRNSMSRMRASVEQAARAVEPSAIVNAAAYTAVDRAESEPERAFAINRDGAERLAVEAQRLGVPLIQISTDYVFDGRKSSPYTEEDAAAPLGVYGRSKLEGEAAVLNACPAALVLRTSWVYSPYGHNFVKTMLRLAETRDHVRVVDDQWGSPTAANDLANAILDILGQLGGEGFGSRAGIYHLAAQGETTWHGFASAIFAGWARARAPGDEAHRDQKRGISGSGAPAGQFTAGLRARSNVNSASGFRRGSGRSMRALTVCWWRRSGNHVEGNHSRGGQRHQALPDHPGSKQTTASDLRQADDLLSIVDTDARGDSRHSRHHDAGGSLAIRAAARRRQPMGHPAPLRRAAKTGGARRRHFRSERISSVPTALRWCWATTSFSDTACRSCSSSQRTGRRERRFSPIRCAIPSATAWCLSTMRDRAVRIEEKPKNAASNWAITGLYFFDNDVVRYAAEVKPSWRGELEITDVHNCYLAAGALHVEKMGRGFAWLDTGTFESLIDAASFVQTLEQRQGMKIACPEEIAYRMGFISRAHLLELAKSLNKSGYGDYLLHILETN